MMVTPRRWLASAIVVALIAVASVACGEQQVADEPAAAAPPTTVTVTGPSTPTPVAPKAETSDAPARTEPGGIRVPNVVGKDHQLAQDTMQAAGLYNLAEEDATGQGRLLLWDRNWVVVSQSPAGGSRVGEDTRILLRSKMDDE
jgi:PASTA domain